MNNLVKINNQEILLKEWNGQRVVTFADIDLVHERPIGTAKRNFSKNKKYFIEGEDYIVATLENAKKYEIRTFEIPTRGLTLLTETGYLMLVKSFTDDLAWTVQRSLVNNYFRNKYEIKNESVNKFKEVIYYQGNPVMTIRDLEKLLKIRKEELNWLSVKYNLGTLLEGEELISFKKENPDINMKFVSCIRVFKRGDVLNLVCYENLPYNNTLMSEYFDRSSLNDYDRLRLYELAQDIVHIANSRGYNTPYKKMLTLIASKIYVECGFLQEETDDLNPNMPLGWNMQQPIIDFKNKIKLQLTK